MVVPETEEDIKLQKELDLMLSSLEKNNISSPKKMNKVEVDNDDQCKEISLQEALYGLIEQIQQASKRTLDNQIVHPSSELQRQLDVASLCGLVDRMNKRRLRDQEWVSNAEQLKRDINELVAKSACFFNTSEEFNDQRFELSAIKERDLYLFQIFSKIDRQRRRRMSNQDARPRRNSDDELFALINSMQQKSSKYTEQRAVLRKAS